jgi:hypothetical protein
MKYDFTAEYGPTTGRLGAVRNDEEELPIEPRQEPHQLSDRHISTFRGYRILFSIRNPYINRFTNHFSIHS